MSDEEVENPVTREELVALLNDADILEAEGFRITPKGYMGLVLMEMGVERDDAEAVAQKMSDRIFLAGFTYLDERQLGLTSEDEEDAL